MKLALPGPVARHAAKLLRFDLHQDRAGQPLESLLSAETSSETIAVVAENRGVCSGHKEVGFLMIGRMRRCPSKSFPCGVQRRTPDFRRAGLPSDFVPLGKHIQQAM